MIGGGKLVYIGIAILLLSILLSSTTLTASNEVNVVRAVASHYLVHETLAESYTGSETSLFFHGTTFYIYNIPDETGKPVYLPRMTVITTDIAPYYPYLESIVYPWWGKELFLETPSVSLVDGNYEYSWSLNEIKEEEFFERLLTLAEVSKESVGFNYKVYCDKRFINTPYTTQHVTLEIDVTEVQGKWIDIILLNPALYVNEEEAHIELLKVSPEPSLERPYAILWRLKGPSVGDKYTFHITLSIENKAYPNTLYFVPAFTIRWLTPYRGEHTYGDMVTIDLNPYGLNAIIRFSAEGYYCWRPYVGLLKAVLRFPFVGTKSSLIQSYAEKAVGEVREWVEKAPMHEGFRRVLITQYSAVQRLLSIAGKLVGEGRDVGANALLKASTYILKMTTKLLENQAGRKIPLNHANLLIYCNNFIIEEINKIIELTPSKIASH